MLQELGTILTKQDKQNARLREQVMALEVLVIALHGEQTQEDTKEAMEGGMDMGVESLIDAFRRQDRERRGLLSRLTEAVGKLSGTDDAKGVRGDYKSREEREDWPETG